MNNQCEIIQKNSTNRATLSPPLKAIVVRLLVHNESVKGIKSASIAARV